ncbi:hypothetical protein [Engelhardtia mirabilis]|uniref:Uncharacterized protein n=1 Tax=Engelhardtia mirabilis TaxID=2528011 RepID=A0A518BID1_9BACT|nr:hypothetical protein Pla133_18070 [Planctomycetes bacterium Pla133]QDV01057.1 hypothetical protein Pla86_18060 [Planctomycetes bacterium Pla86]
MIYIREFIAGLISPAVVLSKPRFSRQLLKFAYTELYTSYDIGAVARRQEGEVREAMERHASDEGRHYKIFKEWAQRVAPYTASHNNGVNFGDPDGVEQPDRRSVRWSAEQEAAPNRRLPELGDYMLYIFLSESRAVIQFKLYQWLNRYDERCRTWIPSVLVDEKRHVAYSLHYAWREFRRAPLARIRGAARVAVYIARQDLVDLSKLIQVGGSAVMGSLFYFLLVTPYGFGLRLLGLARRDRLRRTETDGPVAPQRVQLDSTYWAEQ